MKKMLVSMLVAGALFIGMSNGAVFAAEPNNQACLGMDFSGYAKDLMPLGQVVSTIAHSPYGIGNEVQLHLAGLIPDSVIPNSCND
ncbi:MAG: hypothetical protein HY664_03760, partial [Chloroflexi bacterium]|nr:hypothetical protein [Chloroflexota bacterium]